MKNLKWKCPACGNEDNSSDTLRCVCGYEVKDNIEFAVLEGSDQKLADAGYDAGKPPQKCPQCNHHNFHKLQPEKGTGFALLTIFAFILDLFTPGPTRSFGLETLNQQRPGWMCENCGWEIRVPKKKESV